MTLYRVRITIGDDESVGGTSTKERLVLADDRNSAVAKASAHMALGYSREFADPHYKAEYQDEEESRFRRWIEDEEFECTVYPEPVVT